MPIIAMNTDNPLGQRPFGAMGGGPARLGWMGAATTGPAATPGDFDNNQAVLAQLVSMGAITAQNAADILDGKLSLDDEPQVTMSVINSALSFAGQQGLPIAATNPAITNVVAKAPTSSWAGSAGAVLNAVTPSSSSGSSLATLGLTGTTGIIIGAVAIGLLLVFAGRR